MNIIQTSIQDLLIIEPTVHNDSRGYFYESFNQQTFAEQGLDIAVVQTNISQSDKNVVRGLHYQNPPYAQGKLIRVLKGAVLDVAVDIRPHSISYGKHVAIELNETNKLAFWIPPGFAHGFRTLLDETLFYYDCTEMYNRNAEASILWNDPQLNIEWGISTPILSEKDTNAPLFGNHVSKFT